MKTTKAERGALRDLIEDTIESEACECCDDEPDVKFRAGLLIRLIDDADRAEELERDLASIEGELWTDGNRTVTGEELDKILASD